MALPDKLCPLLQVPLRTTIASGTGDTTVLLDKLRATIGSGIGDSTVQCTGGSYLRYLLVLVDKLRATIGSGTKWHRQSHRDTPLNSHTLTTAEMTTTEMTTTTTRSQQQ